MAGCLPTKTTIRIKSSTGEFTDVPAATRSTAGVMTADHVARLEAVEASVHAGGSDGVVILPPAPAPRLDGVSRAELATTLGQLKSALLQEVGRVLVDVRQPAIASSAPSATSFDVARLERLEIAFLALSERLTNLEQTVGSIGLAFESAVAPQGAAA